MSKFSKLLAFFGKLSRKLQVVIGIALVVVIGIIDYLTGIELNFSIFYLIPVALMAVYAGMWWGVITAILSGIAWLLADYFGGAVHSSALIFYWDDFVRMGFFLIVAVILSRLRITFMELQRLSMNDPLTGLLNFRAFNRAASMEIDRARRNNQVLSVVFLDVDNFKSINDRFGHAVGDSVLKSLAGILRANVRNIDIVGRLGGDEFAVVLPETPEESAQTVFNRIQKIFEQAAQKQEWATTFSAGIATFTKPPNSVEHMLNHADALMYEAKNSGKDHIHHREFGSAPKSA
jgi:diguanylate cyclase (GGDEF)-like protein